MTTVGVSLLDMAGVVVSFFLVDMVDLVDMAGDQKELREDWGRKRAGKVGK
jgi:hypothetical protein